MKKDFSSVITQDSPALGAQSWRVLSDDGDEAMKASSQNVRQ
jgi:hypothetical protein